MSLRPVASLALKLLALWMLVPLFDALGTLLQLSNPAFASSFGLIGVRSVVVPVIVPLLMRACLGIALWIGCDSVAASIVKDDQPFSHIPTPVEWQRLAFAVLGAYFCVSAAHELARVAATVFFSTQDNSLAGTSRNGAANLVPALVQGGLGLWLLLGARGIVRGVANLHQIGRDPETL